MTAQDICSARLPRAGEKVSVCLMDQEIAGTKVTCHVLPAREAILFSACEDYVRILFICSGEVTVQDSAASREFAGRGVFIGKADQAVTVHAKTDARILELCRWLEPDEFNLILHSEALPYCLAYSDASKYTEDCKSPKTVSRMLVPQRLIPRFAMGSVETYGKDRIEKHTHPMLEQFFFSLEENNCIVLIDDLQYPFPGNMLLHIPLGSDHGVLLEEEHACHYLWMDFLLSEDGLQYMDQAHKIVK